MVLDFFRSGHSAIEEVEAKLVQMLNDAYRVYDGAAEALFGAGKSKETKRELRATDRGINVAEQEVRRMLMVHVSVRETVDLPLVLVYMSIVKDVERIGDYAKNIYDLVRYGADFATAQDREELEHYRRVVGRLILDAAEVFSARDTDEAKKLISKADDFLDEYDAKVKAMFAWEGAPADAVARALYYRFLKRITAHVMNFLTGLVMPVDRLDYYDEEPADRV
ncbi:MAG TPA: hypothetical protein ENK55_12080 [Actinobacteria bacterium]|nr:hypothetical protein [Actinomycetota bacterium]